MAIRVVCGANSQELDFAGRSVSDTREYLRQSLNIPREARVLVTGRAVGAND